MNDFIHDHLDLWTTTIKRKSSAGRGTSSKYELYGIKKLRELILELAVRGLLVPQDPTDEPASVLLKRIAAEKARWVKEGVIKQQKALPPIAEEEKPFGLPEGWGSIRLGNVMNVLNGRAYKKHEMLSEGTPLLRVGNLFTSNEWYYSDLALEPEKYIDNGDLIYAWSASFGPFIWQGGKVIYHYHIWKMDFFSPVDVDKFFFRIYLEAISASIKASGNGIAMIHMTKERMEKLVLPIPTLEEQHRIVAKVNELMTLCDQLEQHTETHITTHQTLVETLLSAITSADSAAAIPVLLANFDSLFTTEHSIDQMKQTILQLAVMGKLVPQDPTDEPASVLLKKIAAEKAKLLKEGKIKKQKALPPIAEEEKPFELPEGWAWVQFGSIVSFESELVRPESYPNLDQVAPDSIEKGTGKILFRRTVSASGVTGPNNHFYEGQILYSKIRPSLSKVIIAEFDGLCSADMYPLRVFQISKDFLLRVMLSELFLIQVRREENRIKMPKLNVATLSVFIIPIPPLAEQHRIVTKVNELLTLCDQLKTQLNHAQQTQLHLTDALTGMEGKAA